MNHKLFVAAPVILLTLIASVLMVGAGPRSATLAAASGTGPKPVMSVATSDAGKGQHGRDPGDTPFVQVDSLFRFYGHLNSHVPDHDDGLQDFQVILYDAENVGHQVGNTITLPDTMVDEGDYTLLLDFEPTAFQGSKRWLEIWHRKADHHNRPWQLLSPRTYLAPVPYALSLMPGATITGTINTPGSIMTLSNSGNGYGLISRSIGGRGVYGSSSTNAGVVGVSNSTYGLFGQSTGGSGIGVYGTGYYGGKFTSGSGTGAWGQSASGDGVHGVVTGTGSTGSGVAGIHNGSGYGVYGTSANGDGVYGMSTDHAGVHGSSETNYGVFGQSSGSTGIGVYGTGHYGGEFVSTDGTGVSGQSDAGNGVHGTSTTGNGVRGTSGSGAGVSGAGAPGLYGEANGLDGTGVYGSSTNGYLAKGVEGHSLGGYGVYGDSDGYGVYGHSTTGEGIHGTSVTGKGVVGEATGIGGVGVNAIAVEGTGIRATSSTGYAGQFYGNVDISGTLTKGAGSFKIDDPLDPATKYLSHSFVESPDMMNIYNGNVTLDTKGEAWVQLPRWFQALNQEFRYQLTCIGGFAPVYVAEEIRDNRFKIAGGRENMRVSWQVTGIRHDPYAEHNRIPTEQDKPANERGTYLHPEYYGQPITKRVDNASK